MQCPQCSAELRWASALAGRTVQCSRCACRFQVPDSETGITTARALEAEPAETTLARGAAFVRELGMDLAETPVGQHASERAADQQLAQWKREMPPVPSAYQPSGVLPASALMFMMLGAIVAIPLSVATQAVAAALAAAAVALVGLLNVVIAGCGFIWCLAGIWLILIGLLAIALPFILGGAVCAWTATHFGRLGKNRNVPAAVGLSVCSGGLSVLISWLLFQYAGKAVVENYFQVTPGNLDWLYLVVFVIGLGLAMFFAGATAADRVRTAKFCENCDVYMDETELKTLGLGGLRAVSQALAEERPGIAAAVLEEAPVGEQGKVMLFSCPHCGEGFIDVTAKFKLEWNDGKARSKEETWLAGSLALRAKEVDALLAIREPTTQAGG